MEALEDVFARWNCAARIPDGQHNVVAIGVSADPNPAARAIVLSRVLQEILHYKRCVSFFAGHKQTAWKFFFNFCEASAEYLVDRSSSSAVEARAASARFRPARFSSESSASFFTGTESFSATRWLATKPPNKSSAPAPPICQRSLCSSARE